MAVEESISPRRLFVSYVQTVSTCDDLLERENAVLRAQVHDLTELLAAFDLCELQDAHLKAVRDRAFQRGIAPDPELLQVCRLERWQHQETLFGVLNTDAWSDSRKELEHPGNPCSSSVQDGELERLRKRVDKLEREIGNIEQHSDVPKALTLQIGCPGTDVEPTIETGVELNTDHDGDPVALETRLEEATMTIRELQNQIAELENMVAAKSAESALQQQQSRRYSKIATALADF